MPLASMPSNVRLLSSRDRPLNRMSRSVPPPELIAPGASIMRVANERPLSGTSRICAESMTAPTSAELEIDVFQRGAHLHFFGNAADLEVRVNRALLAGGKNHAVNRD